MQSQSRTLPGNEPIAIIGSGCRFPGDSNSPSKLWELLQQPHDLLSKIPSDRFDAKGFYNPDGMYHGSSNVQDAYLLSDDHRHFDAQFFGIKPVEANAIDPQQRLLLETVYECIESAGLAVESLRGSKTAVYVGLMCGDYESMLLRDLDSIPTYHATGVGRSIISNRISYFFDWHGPSMTIDTACSSSLVAVHQAVQVLRSGDSRVALAAGSNMILGPENFIGESKLKMLSPDGRSRMWDVGANGYARGEGIAAIVLKTLSAALEDGDHIECLIRETGINQDGRTKGITMPSSTAQANLIRDTYSKAGLDPKHQADRCQFFEAHGTGTPAGDPIEAEAISTAFFDAPPSSGRESDAYTQKEARNPLFVGSIKTVIGHTEGTAGLAAVLKASLALQNSVIPPNMLFDQLNPSVKPFYKNLEIPITAKPWPTIPDGQPRRASVNSFGFGGANAHAILESYEPAIEENFNSKISQVATPFTFSANSERSLTSTLSAYSTYLKANKDIDLGDLAWTLQSRRSMLPVRAAFSSTTIEGLCSKIDAKLESTQNNVESSIGVRSPLKSSTAKLLGIFTGQGAQWASMGRELILESKFVRDLIKSLERSLNDLPVTDRPLWSLESELLADSSSSRINEAALSQPLCTAVQIVLVDLLRHAGIKFEAVVGHSSGEIGAIYAAGYISARDAIRIAYYRGFHAKLACGPEGKKGAMIAVGTSFEDAQELCELPYFEGRISVAAINSSASVTISGDADAIEETKIVFDDEKKFARVLLVDKAYHSHHMLPCSHAYIKSLKTCGIQVCYPTTSDTSWFSSVCDGEIEDANKRLEDVYWNDNMVNPVLFLQAIEKAFAAKGSFDLAIEVGPHPALKGPASQNIQGILGDSIPYTGLLSRGKNDLEAFTDGLGLLWTYLGDTSVDFDGFNRAISGGAQFKLLKGLPVYTWEHDRAFWHESRLSRTFRTRHEPVHELLGRRCPDGTKEQLQWRNLLSPKEVPWLSGHQLQDQVVFPAAGYVAMALEASKTLTEKENVRLIEVQDFVIHQAMTFNDDESGVETLFTVTNVTRAQQDLIQAGFSFYSAVGKEADAMTLMATGRLQITIGEISASLLPPRALPESNMVDVETERFYSSLAELGYGYTGPFRALSSMKRKWGQSTGLVAKPVPDDPEKALMVHPGLLDAAIQAIILAYSYPNDGRLWSLLLPTSIQSIRVNPSLCTLHSEREHLLPFDSSLRDVDSAALFGDVDVYTEDGQYAVIQVEGMQAVPFSGATLDNDTLLFSKMVYEPAMPNGDLVAADTQATAEEYELAYLLERVSYYYLRNLDKQIPQNHSARKEGPYKGLFGFMAHVHSLVSSGKHSYAKKEWVDDDLDMILTASNKYTETLDVQIMHIIGQQMPAVIRGQTTVLEHLMQNDLLNSYYMSALGVPPSNKHLARMTAQISHRYPHINILEIGAGTGGATKGVLQQLNGIYSSYTFTDVSDGFFEKAQGLFSSHREKVIFKTLDIEKDTSSQGFADHSYDVIIASLVLHATSNLEQTMRNVRRLIKPGGYILMLEMTNNDLIRIGYVFGALPGWWLGAEDGRALSPCVTSVQWDSVLRKTGFSGIDAVTPDLDSLPFPASVIASQAVDQRIDFLRLPLSSPFDASKAGLPIQDLMILGGSTLKTARLMGELGGILGHFCGSVTCASSLEDIDFQHLSTRTTVLSLTELDEPIFKSMTESKFDGLKKTFEQAQRILWITQGCRADNPYSNMTLGFGRSMLWEIPHIRLQFLDLDSSERPDARNLAETLLRFNTACTWEQEGSRNNMLWSIEPEIVLNKTQQLIPRLLLDAARNDRYNSSRRSLVRYLDPQSSAVDLSQNGSTYVLQEAIGNAVLPCTTGTTFATIRVSHSLISSLPIATNGYLYTVLGTVIDSGEQVLALSQTQASIVNVPEGHFIPCHVPIGREVAFISFIANNILASFIIARVSGGDTILVHEADPVFTVVLGHHAAKKQVHVVHTTTQSRGVHPSEIFIHPHASERGIREMLPEKISLFVDLSADTINKSVVARIATYLPVQCVYLDNSKLFRKHSHACSLSSIDSIKDLLRTAWLSSHQETSEADDVGSTDGIAVSDLLVQDRTIRPATVVDWTNASTVPVQVEPVDSRNLFAKNKTYWLVGLSGGMGLSLCEWMVRHGARFVVISSRNPKIDSQWLSNMSAKGATIKIFSNDITNKHDVQSLHKEICSTLPPIAGVAQGAMVLQDTSARDMSIADMTRVLMPKVDGSKYLDELFSENTLDFFIFFSSTTGVVGNIGQSNYTAANTFMVSLAAQRRKRGLAASVINIGAIIGVGFITREVSQADQNNLRKGGYMWMSERDFHQTFAEAVLAGHPESGQDPEISTGLRRVNANEPYKTIWFNNPKFSHFVLQQVAVEANGNNAKAGVPIKTQLLVATDQEQVYEIIKNSFVSKLQSILQFRTDGSDKDSSMLDLRTEELGIDSLIAVEIRSWFLKSIDVNMPVLKILGGASVRELLDHAVENLPQDLIPGLSASSDSESGPISLETSLTVVTPPSNDSSIISSKVSVSEHQDSCSERESESPPSSTSESGQDIQEITQYIPKPVLQRTEAISYGQSMFWFLQIYLGDPTSLNHTGYFRFKGRLRINDFARAVQMLAERHEALRTCFFVDETQQPMQGILKSPILHLEQRNIKDKAAADREFEAMKTHIFDLKRGETMRFLLLSQSPIDHHLIIGGHHINVDGISLQVIWADLERAYNRQPFNTNVLQYPDFAARQREEYKSAKWEKELAYWRREFPNFPPPLPILSLSETTSRRPLNDYAVHRVDFRIDSSFAMRIQETCRQYKATPFHFYLATFKALLLRFMDAEDLCIGIGDANRTEEDMLDCIGPYLNLLPLRFLTQPMQTFSDALSEARDKAYLALANSQPPLEVILNELGVSRSSTYSPLFQTFVDYRRGTLEKRTFGECQLEMEEFETGRVGYDLSLDIIDNTGGDSLIMLIFQKSLYTRADGETLMKCFVNLLEAFCDDPTMPLDQPNHFTPQDVETAIELGRGSFRDSEWPETLVHRVDTIAQIYGETPALKDGGGITLTYSQMAQRVGLIAAALLSANTGAGSIVAVFQEPTTDWICSLLAIMRVGAVYLPLDLSISIQRLASVVADSKPSIILIDEVTEEASSALQFRDAKRISVSTLSSSNAAAVTNVARAESPAVIFYTSGSTGTPKGIVIKHSSICNEIECSAETYKFGAENVLQQSALSFDMSLTQIFTALAYGGTVYVVPRRSRGDPVALSMLIGSEKISFTGATPSEYISWLRHGEPQGMSNWRTAITGGEQVTNALLREFRALGKPDLRLFNAYGPTEVTCSSNKMELIYAKDSIFSERIPAGYTSPNYSVYIVDENMKPVPVGVPGEILVGGVGVAIGYLNNEELTRQKFVPDDFATAEYVSKGWTTMHRTGDRGRWRSDGSILIEGRIAGDTQVKLRGLRIDLHDIENVIIQTANGALAEAVVSVRGEMTDDLQFLVAHVVFAPKYPVKEREELLERLQSKLPLPQYMHPAICIPLDHLPVNSSSKLDRLAIRSLPLPQVLRQDPVSIEFSETETLLREIWEEVIPEDIGNNFTIDGAVDFFHIGGNSLLLVHLQALIRRRFDIILPLVQLFESSTLRSMAARIDDATKALKAVSIDWEQETQLSTYISHIHAPLKTGTPAVTPKVIVLTGATGFVGKVLLRQLIEQEDIVKIHCIAVRPSYHPSFNSDSSKVLIHEGDLKLPRLGLSEEMAMKIFEEADVVIHNGADVSHLKTYHTLKPANLNSTKELIMMSLPRRLPFHYISTAGVALLSGKDAFGEISAADYFPPYDGSDGYTASKWASERYLEKVHEAVGLPVWIHRPSSIIRDDGSQDLDLLQSLLKYSRLMGAVPVSPNLRGALDLVKVDNVVRGVLRPVFHGEATPPTVQYLHQTGDFDIPMTGLKAFLDKESGGDCTILSLREWASRAKSLGLHEVVVAFFEKVEDLGVITFPRLVKREGGI